MLPELMHHGMVDLMGDALRFMGVGGALGLRAACSWGTLRPSSQRALQLLPTMMPSSSSSSSFSSPAAGCRAQGPQHAISSPALLKKEKKDKNYKAGVWEQACRVGEGSGSALAARPKSGCALPRGQRAQHKSSGAQHAGIPPPAALWAGPCAGAVVTR